MQAAETKRSWCLSVRLDILDRKHNLEERPPGHHAAGQMGTPDLGWYRLPGPPFHWSWVQLMDICHSPTTADPATVRAVMKYV